MKKKSTLLILIFLTYFSFAQTEIEVDRFVKIIDQNSILVNKDNIYYVIDTLGNRLTNNNLVIEDIDKFLEKDNCFFFGFDLNHPTNNGEMKEKSIIFNISEGNVLTIDNLIDAQYFNDNMALILIEKKINHKIIFEIFVIDKNGNKLFDLPNNAIKKVRAFIDYYHSPFQNGLARISVLDPNSIRTTIAGSVYIDKNGHKISNEIFQNAEDFSEGLALVSKKINNKTYWGFINKQGINTIDFKYTIKPTDFSDGMSRVKTKNKLYGYINTLGELVIKPQYIFATGFYKEQAIVKMNNENYKIINKKGETIKEFVKLRKFTDFDRSSKQIKYIKQLVDENRVKANLKGFYYAGFMDYDENLHNEYKSEFHLTGNFKNGLAIFKSYNKNTRIKGTGIIDKNGKILLVKSQNQF